MDDGTAVMRGVRDIGMHIELVAGDPENGVFFCKGIGNCTRKPAGSPGIQAVRVIDADKYGHNRFRILVFLKGEYISA
jgi:hypothetical protein